MVHFIDYLFLAIIYCYDFYTNLTRIHEVIVAEICCTIIRRNDRLVYTLRKSSQK